MVLIQSLTLTVFISYPAEALSTFISGHTTGVELTYTYRQNCVSL